jgi:hypothetical protein
MFVSYLLLIWSVQAGTQTAIDLSGKCSSFTDCFNCTLKASCLWSGSKCSVIPGNSGSGGYGNNYGGYGNSYGQYGGYSGYGGYGGGNSYFNVGGYKLANDGYQIRSKGMSFNSGNTFNVLSKAGVCGDPLKVCTQSKSGSLMTKGFS